jgi:hypothetical protein
MNESYGAVKKSNGEFFVGKGGTATGYPKLGNLKLAMSHKGSKKENYLFFKMTTDVEKGITIEWLEM